MAIAVSVAIAISRAVAIRLAISMAIAIRIANLCPPWADSGNRGQGRRPTQHKLSLAAVQAALQPDPPDDEVVRAQAGEDVPPAMTFKQRSPREQDGVPGAAQVGAEGVVQDPEGETCKEEDDAFGITQLR